MNKQTNNITKMKNKNDISIDHKNKTKQKTKKPYKNWQTINKYAQTKYLIWQINEWILNIDLDWNIDFCWFSINI